MHSRGLQWEEKRRQINSLIFQHTDSTNASNGSIKSFYGRVNKESKYIMQQELYNFPNVKKNGIIRGLSRNLDKRGDD